MTYIPNQLSNTGLFIPTTYIFDLTQVAQVDIKSQEFKDLLVRLYQTVNSVALSLNIKDTGLYPLEEFVTGSRYFNPTSPDPERLRIVFRRTFNTGAIGAGVTNVAHGLTIAATWTFTRIYGSASDNVGPNYYPLPFASAGGAANIEVYVDGTNIVITNNSGVAFTSGYVVLEYLKS
jgi:hypothetical protein